MCHDLPGAEEHARSALALARRWGLRGDEGIAAGNLMYVLTITGRFDEAFQLGTELFEAGGDERPGAETINLNLAHLAALRGNSEAARDHVSKCGAESDEVQYRANYAAAEAAASLAEGRSREALAAARRAIHETIGGALGIPHEAVRLAFPIALEAAIEIGDLEEADQLAALLATRPRGEVPPFLRAQVTRAVALVAHARGEDETVEENLAAVEMTFRDLGYPYWTARAQLDRAQWLADQGQLHERTKLAAEAAAAFETIGAASMLARARALLDPEIIPRTLSVDDKRAVAQNRPSPSQ